MIVIVKTVTAGNGDVNEAATIKVAKEMKKDIADLQR
jgi:hypothetical protein